MKVESTVLAARDCTLFTELNNYDNSTRVLLRKSKEGVACL